MAAAYAAVVSLINTMDHVQISHPRLFLSSFDNKQFQSLQEYAVFFQHFLEDSNRQEEALESQIAAAAREAEDVIGSHAMDQILARSTGESSNSLLDLQKVTQDMDSVKEKVMEVVKGKEMQPLQTTNSAPATSSRLVATVKSSMVGFDDYLIQLMNMLVGQQSSLLIISVTGMGGMGKSTLTKNAYEHLAIVQHFDVRGWGVISQQHNEREILVQLLSCLTKEDKTEMAKITEEQLGLKLYQFLCGRRYLIVLDDMWSIEAWDKIKFFFPDNGNSSRIVVTTRESNVASHFGSLSLVMNFLHEDKSWDLFCVEAFGHEDECPPELKEIGKKIAQKCKGLPLSIVVIAGLLKKSNGSQEYWENVASDINSILLNSKDDEIGCFNVLSLSYTYLPAYLKPCFLYMGVFREDHEINISTLIQLWVAEGFLKPNNPQSLEEVAYGYFRDLVDRNLLLADRILDGEIRTCKIHDLLRDLCLRVCEKEKVLCFTRVLGDRLGIDNERRIVFSKRILEDEYDPKVFDALQSGSLARAMLLDTHGIWGIPSYLRSLVESERNLLKPVFQQVRYIACDVSAISMIPSPLLSSMCLLWNLQTLVISGGFHPIQAPSEIWDMRQLKLVKVHRLCLPDPPWSDQQDDILVNLHTLRQVLNFNLIEEVCKRIPNIKELRMRYDLGPGETFSNYCLYNLRCFHKLEKLECVFGILSHPNDLLQNLMFPTSLKELSLSGSELKWEDLAIIGSLPHLELLRLDNSAAIGAEWNPVEGQFQRLKFLYIEYCAYLIYWNADNSHFPVLVAIHLGRLQSLDEIPLSIGDIPSLRFIYLWWCSESAAISAIKILEEQESYGNEDLQVSLDFYSAADLESFKEKVESHTLTTHNLKLDVR